MAFLNAISNGENIQGAADNAQSALSDSFDQFLTLLTAQLQEQDPLDPLDSNEFTDQLVQFTGVEQQIQTNQNLEQLTGLMLASANSQAVTYLGQIATVESAFADYDGSPVDWGYQLGRTAQNVTLQVVDSFGNVVTEVDGETALGRQEFIWDGLDENGERLPDGTYQLNIIAEDADGENVPARILLSDLVEAVDTSESVAVLTIGGTRANLGDILEIRVPSAERGSSNPSS